MNRGQELVPGIGVVESGDMAFLYKITNNINKKSYIGWTSKSVDIRWKQHKFDAFNKNTNRKFYNAIKKYGIDCWDVQTLMEVSTNGEAKEKEIELILYYKTYEVGYNSTLGGDGNNGIVMTKESNDKRSIKLKGIKRPDGWNTHRTHSEDSKNKISASHLGMKKPWVKWTDEQIQKRAMTRRVLTKEQYDMIYELRNKGLYTKDIANVVGVSNDVVKKWLHKSW